MGSGFITRAADADRDADPNLSPAYILLPRRRNAPVRGWFSLPRQARDRRFPERSEALIFLIKR